MTPNSNSLSPRPLPNSIREYIINNHKQQLQDTIIYFSRTLFVHNSLLKLLIPWTKVHQVLHYQGQTFLAASSPIHRLITTSIYRNMLTFELIKQISTVLKYSHLIYCNNFVPQFSHNVYLRKIEWFKKNDVYRSC